MAINVSCINHPHYGCITVQTSPGSIPSGVNKVRISKKISSKFVFVSVYLKTVSTTADLTFTFDDYLCRNNVTYQYKVDYIHDIDSTSYNIIESQTFEIKCMFDLLVIKDSGETYATPLNAFPINTNTIRPFVLNTPLMTKKPSYYSIGNAQYKEGTAQGVWLKMVGEENNIQFETDQNWEYREKFVSFLCNGLGKLLKSVSGEMWLVGIKSDGISDNSLFSTAEVDGARQIEFGWIEIGEVESENDLYENGLINVPSKYWSGT